MELNLATRFRVRTSLIRLRRKVSGGDVEAINKILAHKEAFETFAETVTSEYESYVQAGGPLTDFLQWVLDNQEAIIALVKTIIELFSK